VVVAYTELNTQQKVYDFFNYFGTSSTGIDYAYDLAIQSNVLVSLGNKNISFASTGDVGTYNGTAYAIKASQISGIKISTGGTITLNDTTPVYPIQFASSTGTSNWLKIDLATNQYALLNNTVHIDADFEQFIAMGDVSPRTIKIAQYSRVPQSVTRTPASVLLDTVSVTLDLNPKVFDTL